MNYQSLFTFYIPKQSWLHRLHIKAKLLWLVISLCVIFVTASPLALLGIQVFLTTLTLALRLILRHLLFLTISTGFLIWLAVGVEIPPIVSAIGLTIGRFSCLSLLIALFTMTTKPNDMLAFLCGSANSRPTLQSISYVFTILLGILPSVFYDLQKAIDAETLRRERRPSIFAFGAWRTILTTLLVRVTFRTQRLAETVVDRGYSLNSPFTHFSLRTFNRYDIAKLLVLLVPYPIAYYV